MINKKIVIAIILLSMASPMSIKASSPISTNICNIESPIVQSGMSRQLSETITPINYDIFTEIQEMHKERLSIEITQRLEEEKLNREIEIKKNKERLSQGTAGQQALAFALGEMGMPYYWGAEGVDDYDKDGDTRAGYDCSGLVQWAYWKAGYSIPRTTSTQWRVGELIQRANAEEGDLIYFLNNKKRIFAMLIDRHLAQNIKIIKRFSRTENDGRQWIFGNYYWHARSFS